MPLTVPAPWTCTADVKPGSPLRFRLAWTRPPADDPPRLIGVVMYNPAFEGEVYGYNAKVQHGTVTRSTPMVRDGATHRRVRSLLADATEIRVVNLSPVRTTKPVEARRACKALVDRDVELQQAHALAWACEAPTVVAAWGAGPFTARMERSRAEVLRLAQGRLWCWGTTQDGHPLHPSPLGRVGSDAELVRFGVG